MDGLQLLRKKREKFLLLLAKLNINRFFYIFSKLPNALQTFFKG